MTNYLGIDPGRSKTGLALLDADGNILQLYIAQTCDFAKELRYFVGDRQIAQIIMGNGTNNKVISKIVQKVFPDVALELVGEAHSTEEARSLYWQVNPPKGWKKLVPLGLLVPPEPLDAYAAVVQVRRWMNNER